MFASFIAFLNGRRFAACAPTICNASLTADRREPSKHRPVLNSITGWRRHDAGNTVQRAARWPATKLRCFYLAALAILLVPAAARAATYTAASCSSSDFSTAIASATDGDTVQGPADGGNASWTSNVTVTKGITLNFNGCSISPNGYHLYIAADTVASTTVTGLTCTGCAYSGGTDAPIQFQTSHSPYSMPFRFYNNTLSGSGTFIFIDGSQNWDAGANNLGPGLIDHNSFTASAGADEIIHILGCGSGTACWTPDVTPGSENMIVVENNVFTETSTTYPAAAEEAYYGAVFAWRYNQMHYAGNDIHGYNGTDYAGRWAEIYNNTYYGSSGTDCCIYMRGGSGVYFNNTLIGNAAINVGPLCGSSDYCGGSWPMPSQTGRGITGTTYSPQYIWGNIDVAQIVNETKTYIQIGGSPADATNCTGHPGNVCDAISTAVQPATLERCQSAADVSAGCPVSYTYTPYTYPHPLDNCSITQYGAGATCTNSVKPGTPGGLTGSLVAQ